MRSPSHLPGSFKFPYGSQFDLMNHSQPSDSQTEPRRVPKARGFPNFPWVLKALEDVATVLKTILIFILSLFLFMSS